jgi:hypothetical protein
MSLQILIIFDYYFQILWGALTFTFLYYKKYSMIYPEGFFELEMLGIFILLPL